MGQSRQYRCLDTDIVVQEVRETSRKPDEVYGLIDQMCPSGRKIKLFLLKA